MSPAPKNPKRNDNENNSDGRGRKKSTGFDRGFGGRTDGRKGGSPPGGRLSKSVKRSKKDKAIQFVFEDNDMVVVSKPSGLLTVPIPNMQSINLLETINSELSIINEKIITVHRIDRFTSGLVVFAKNSNAHKDLVRQFLSHTPIRTYLALVRGIIVEDEGELLHYLKKINRGFRNVVVPEGDPDGTLARMTFKVLERHAETTLVQINLDTGLKNQIRVQMAEYGHPLVGDRHYSPEELHEEKIDRQALHAWKLSFAHPKDGKKMKFEADIPTDLRRLIDYYKKVE